VAPPFVQAPQEGGRTQGQVPSMATTTPLVHKIFRDEFIDQIGPTNGAAAGKDAEAAPGRLLRPVRRLQAARVRLLRAVQG
jgi:hypothetical protein